LSDRTVLYSHPDCSYSAALKDELESAGAKYEEIDLALHPEAWEDLETLTGGERITPVLIEGTTISIGFYGAG
jgi:glutaredoxin